MKVSFFSNYLNHHQLPFCKEMYRLLKNDFRFIATKPLSQERLALGWEDISNRYPFSINSYENQESYNKARELGDNSDILIIGSAPRAFIEKTLQDNKITFFYSERILKRGRWRLLNPRLAYNLIKNHTYKELDYSKVIETIFISYEQYYNSSSKNNNYGYAKVSDMLSELKEDEILNDLSAK